MKFCEAQKVIENLCELHGFLPPDFTVRKDDLLFSLIKKYGIKKFAFMVFTSEELEIADEKNNFVAMRFLNLKDMFEKSFLEAA